MFPYEYQRVLRQLAEAKNKSEVDNKTAVHVVNSNIGDIEETINDSVAEKKRLEKILDKSRLESFIKNKSFCKYKYFAFTNAEDNVLLKNIHNIVT